MACSIILVSASGWFDSNSAIGETWPFLISTVVSVSGNPPPKISDVEPILGSLSGSHQLSQRKLRSLCLFCGSEKNVSGLGHLKLLLILNSSACSRL